MWISNEMLKNDLDNLVHLDYIEWEKFREKTFFITGATGIVGYNLISGLVYANLHMDLNLRVIAYIRDYDKALKKYAEHMRDCDCLEFILGDIVEFSKIHNDIDYIIHLASPTDSSYFVEKPVETIKTAVIGTMNVLELAREKRVKGMIYASSMEIYGQVKSENPLFEEDLGYLNPLLVRNCYPEGKRQCESMCVAYASEYGVPVINVRLAQTFGLGVDKNDVRVFAEFARSIIEKRDIVLLTAGNSKRCYLYTMDAVSAILTILTKGKVGTAYNAGNPNTYCSVYEMAEIVVRSFGQNDIMIRKSENTNSGNKYPLLHFYNLETSKLYKLGWRPEKDLLEIYQILIDSFKNQY